MQDFVSEPITPHKGTFATQPMASGLPGLPLGFDWRGDSRSVVEVLGTWKASSREGGRPRGELYLRRHYFRLRMSDESVWTVYFIRQASKSSARQRWFLFSIDEK